MQPNQLVQQLNANNCVAVLRVDAITPVKLNVYSRTAGPEKVKCPYPAIFKHATTQLLVGVSYNDLINHHNKLVAEATGAEFEPRVAGKRAWGEVVSLNVLTHNGRYYIGGIPVHNVIEVPEVFYTEGSPDGPVIAETEFEESRTAQRASTEPFIYNSFSEDTIQSCIITEQYQCSDLIHALTIAHSLATQ